jgi:hypothetical protein
MKKSYANVIFIFLLLFFFSFDAKTIGAIEDQIIFDNDYKGTYIFSSIDIELKNENVDITKYECLNENIFIKIIEINKGSYRIESNLWLLEKQMDLDKEYDTLNISCLTQELHPPAITDEYPLFESEELFNMTFHENMVTIDYTHKESYLEEIRIIESTIMAVEKDGATYKTFVSTTKKPYYGPFVAMIRCRLIFTKNN